MTTFIKLSPLNQNAKHFASLEKVGSQQRRQGEKTSECSMYFTAHPFQIATVNEAYCSEYCQRWLMLLIIIGWFHYLLNRLDFNLKFNWN